MYRYRKQRLYKKEQVLDILKYEYWAPLELLPHGCAQTTLLIDRRRPKFGSRQSCDCYFKLLLAAFSR
ncbi:hypothetical protein E2C01_079177 [Portunus trituberculatus]|uniref:Uncharacterized protein n=1 Tax=Portunus trituberculatus TaxID=210409 RepID=A0A5B7IQS3_PORTR|nr:hypothetical protein [Portunus trituberculatus]